MSALVLHKFALGLLAFLDATFYVLVETPSYVNERLCINLKFFHMILFWVLQLCPLLFFLAWFLLPACHNVNRFVASFVFLCSCFISLIL